MKKFWLVKSEPSDYSIDDLKKDGKTAWTGVRNYEARNFMRDDMKKEDGLLFYHSNIESPAVVGLARVSREAYPDPTQFDKKGKYYEPKAEKDNPRWHLVDVGFLKKFKNAVTLSEIKSHPKLGGIMVAEKGRRLSIQPVSQKHFEIIKKLGQK